MRLFVLIPLVGCSVDMVGANGEYGRVNYQLHTEYYVEERDLTEVGIVANHEQDIYCQLTEEGQKAAGDDAGRIDHRIVPGTGASLWQDDEDGDVPDVHVTVNEPGEYAIEAVLDGDVFDRITLTFEAPSSLQMLSWLREPYAEQFGDESGTGSETVGEGTQLAFLGIALDEGGDRLAGDIDTTFSATPDWMVVPAQNVYDVTEEATWQSATVPSLYFIEPGEVSVTLSDTENDAAVTRDFTVEAVEQG